jgi:hypothetical protein
VGCDGFVGWVVVVVVSLCSIRWVSSWFLGVASFFNEEIYGGKSKLVIIENILQKIV